MCSVNSITARAYWRDYQSSNDAAAHSGECAFVVAGIENEIVEFAEY